MCDHIPKLSPRGRASIPLYTSSSSGFDGSLGLSGTETSNGSILGTYTSSSSSSLFVTGIGLFRGFVTGLTYPFIFAAISARYASPRGSGGALARDEEDMLSPKPGAAPTICRRLKLPLRDLVLAGVAEPCSEWGWGAALGWVRGVWSRGD